MKTIRSPGSPEIAHQLPCHDGFALRIAARLSIAMVCLAAMSGCEPAPRAVEGRVTLDGKPLNEAVILFVPLAKGRKKTGGVIVDGKFHLAAINGLHSGEYRVEIADNPPLDSHRARPHAAAHKSTATQRRVIPPIYSTDSPLRVRFGDDEPAPLEFHLETSP
jgi:hypothetical protein